MRVLIRIGEHSASRKAVFTALQSVDRDTLVEHVSRDVSEAVGRLGVRAGPSVTSDQRPRTRVEQWPGMRPVSRVELRFHEDMLALYRLAGEATRRRRPDGTTARGHWLNTSSAVSAITVGRPTLVSSWGMSGTSYGFQRC